MRRFGFEPCTDSDPTVVEPRNNLRIWDPRSNAASSERMQEFCWILAGDRAAELSALLEKVDKVDPKYWLVASACFLLMSSSSECLLVQEAVATLILMQVFTSFNQPKPE